MNAVVAGDDALPAALAVNAWTGEEAPASPLGNALKWALQPPATAKSVLWATLADPRDWKDPTVGWGLVLPEDESIAAAQRARAEDAPDAIRRLLASRPGSPVFRYRPELGEGFLRRYYEDGSFQDTRTSGGESGTGRGRLPKYLLIYGPPTQVPWSLQFFLNVAGWVGRLDLEGAGLDHYVDALIGDWAVAASRSDSPLVWSVDHGGSDITSLMRKAIAEPLFRKWTSEPAIDGKATGLFAAGATKQSLVQALAASRPALVVTTSHGMTGPLGDPAAMRAQLGHLVDQAYATVGEADLLAQWQPDGAVWYAHACCSAGSDAGTRFAELVPADSTVDRVLRAVGSLGAMTAPLPRALLGAPKPLRAFIGHVEPTFDWTLRAETGQPLTASIIRALHFGMYQQSPERIGMAMDANGRTAGAMFAQNDAATRQVNAAGDAAIREAAKARAVRSLLAGLDRQSMVILGDPTACLPPLPG